MLAQIGIKIMKSNIALRFAKLSSFWRNIMYTAARNTIVNIAGHLPVTISNIALTSKQEVLNYLSDTYSEMSNMEHSTTTDEQGNVVHNFTMVDGTKN